MQTQCAKGLSDVLNELDGFLGRSKRLQRDTRPNDFNETHRKLRCLFPDLDIATELRNMR